ncbi:MAG: IMP dehydrogenase [Candidatus Aenigmarchaeota archaeon]|nr:IMP dehydrogenase [Candidatus Aenigmarchaeota archaeon]
MAELDYRPGTTYQDWLLRPNLARKSVKAETISLKMPLTSHNPGCSLDELRSEKLPKELFSLNTPFLTAPMQAISSPEMFAEIAKHGGLGVANCSQPIESEVDMIRRTKRKKAGFVEPDVVSPDMTIDELAELTKAKRYDTFPVTERGNPHGRLLGIITRNDYSKQEHSELKVGARMVSITDDRRQFVYARLEELGDDEPLRTANRMLLDSHHGSMPIIDREGNLHYMVFRRDIERHRDYPQASIDKKKRYLVGAAVNTHDYEKRVPAVVEAEADIIVVDSSQGYSEYQADTIGFTKREFPWITLIGGNIVTAKGFNYLASALADVAKVGIGPGSICTTQHKFRMGMPMMEALKEVFDARNAFFEATGRYIPIIGDGGIVDNADIAIALTLCDAIMAGRYFARFQESPTAVIDWEQTIDGVPFHASVKPYWGEGSARAQEWRAGRYRQATETEGIEGVVPFAGRLSDPQNLPRTIDHLKITMEKCGYSDIFALNRYAELKLQSQSSKAQGMPHNIMTEGLWAPYKVR